MCVGIGELLILCPVFHHQAGIRRHKPPPKLRLGLVTCSENIGTDSFEASFCCKDGEPYCLQGHEHIELLLSLTVAVSFRYRVELSTAQALLLHDLSTRTFEDLRRQSQDNIFDRGEVFSNPSTDPQGVPLPLRAIAKLSTVPY
jgi:hypothetical protein